MLVSLIFPLLLFVLVLILAKIEEHVVPLEELAAPDAEAEAPTPQALDVDSEYPLTNERMRRERAELPVEPAAHPRLTSRVGGSAARSARKARVSDRRVGPWRRAA